MTPNEYIEKLYEKQGFKVVCSSVEVELSHNAGSGKNLEGKFTLVSCTNPLSLLIVEGLQFLNFYMDHTELSKIDGSRDRVPTGVVDFFFFSKGGEVAVGLLQSFAAQFSKGS